MRNIIKYFYILYKTVFYSNPGIFCVIFHTIIQKPQEARTRVGSNLFTFQSVVYLKLSRRFSGKSACTAVIS